MLRTLLGVATLVLMSSAAHTAMAQPFTQNEQKGCNVANCTVKFPPVAAGHTVAWTHLSCNTDVLADPAPGSTVYFVVYKINSSGTQLLNAWIPGTKAGAGGAYTLFDLPTEAVFQAGDQPFVSAISPMQTTTGTFLKCAATGTMN